jgi:hypothetical protein
MDPTYASYLGTWGTSTYAPGYYGANYHYHTAASGTDTFTWTITITTPGTYEVFARWTDGDTRAPDATYTIYHDGGSTDVVKDQRSNGGTWVSLGTYDFDGTGVEKVELVQSASGIVIADAIMVTPEVVDNPEGTFTGSWTLSTWGSGYYGADYRYHAPESGSDTFTWTPTITTPGTYEVYARWTEHSNRAPDATYTIYHDGGSTPVTKDQQNNGGEWVSLGTYSFDGVGDYVELIQSPNGYVIADAITWVPPGAPIPDIGIYAPSVIGDNFTYGFYATGHGAHGWVECLSCHNARIKHIDHKHRTYASASDNYQAGYRLAKSMVVPRPGRGDLWAYLDDFALCGDCHNLYEVLGQNEGDVSHTNFWDDDGSPRNSHPYHIKGTGDHFDSDWDGVNDSTETCITCHNVHGPPNQAMIRHGELISTYGTTDKVPGLNFCYLTSLSPEVCDTDADLQYSVGSKIAPNTSLNEFMCNGCHSSRTLERDPYLGPKVLTTKADPDPAPRDGETDVILTAVILDHNGNVNSVTIDLTDIGGGSTTMYDDGDTENHGDEVSGDGTYSCKTTIPGSVDDEVKSLLVEADDPDGPTGTNYLVMTVKDPAVVDNPEGSYTGFWVTSSYGSGYYGSDYGYHAPGSGSDTFTWTPTIPTAGTYEVFAWWTEHSNRAPDATYTIYYDGGSIAVAVDQRINGSQWNSLGTFAFDGTGDYVELSESPNGYVIADAIKFEPVP